MSFKGWRIFHLIIQFRKTLDFLDLSIFFREKSAAPHENLWWCHVVSFQSMQSCAVKKVRFLIDNPKRFPFNHFTSLLMIYSSYSQKNNNVSIFITVTMKSGLLPWFFLYRYLGFFSSRSVGVNSSFIKCLHQKCLSNSIGLCIKYKSFLYHMQQYVHFQS